MSSVFGTTQTTFKPWIWLLLSSPNYLWLQLWNGCNYPGILGSGHHGHEPSLNSSVELHPFFQTHGRQWRLITFFWRSFSEPVIKAKLRMWWISVHSQSEQPGRFCSVHQFDHTHPKQHTTKGTSVPFSCCVFGLFIPDSVGEKFPDHIPQIMQHFVSLIVDKEERNYLVGSTRGKGRLTLSIIYSSEVNVCIVISFYIVWLSHVEKRKEI